MKNGYLIRIVHTIMLILLFLGISATNVLADGTETLGTPSIGIASGSGMVANGTGLLTQPGTISINVPMGTTVKQVLLYWEGQHTSLTGDDTIIVNTVSITGNRIGGPTKFFNNVYSSTYRADITEKALTSAWVVPGSNTLTVDGLNFDYANNGAGILVIYDDGITTADIKLRDGNDLAFINSAPPLDTTVAQNFTFDPAAVDRTADLSMFFSSVSGIKSGYGPLRPTAINITVNATTYSIINQLSSNDGDEWDTLTIDVVIPAGTTSLEVQALSIDLLGISSLPASFAWNAAALSLPIPVLANPAITIKKYTNGSDADTAPGPYIAIGNPVIWTYNVTNIGNVDLDNVIVTDDKGVTVTCPKTTLAVGESMTCTASGMAAAGQYENIGTANGTNGSKTVTATDPSHYYGKAKTLVTRTPGYWQTHYVEADREWAKVVAAGNALQCGAPENFIVNNTPGLEGGFWSSISYETNKHKRTSVDQARMQLAFQLLAAILNNQAFGSDPGGTVLNDARTNFCGTDKNAMLTSKSLLDTFNNGGSSKLFPTGYINGKADPKKSQSVAAKVYWNQPTLPGIP